MISPRYFSPVISPDLESLLERLKRLYFSKPVTRRLTPGSNDYTNPNTNPTRPLRHVTWTGGRSLGGNHRGKITGGNHRGEIYRGEITGGNHRGEFTCFGLNDAVKIIYAFFYPFIFRRHCLNYPLQVRS